MEVLKLVLTISWILRQPICGGMATNYFIQNLSTDPNPGKNNYKDPYSYHKVDNQTP